MVEQSMAILLLLLLVGAPDTVAACVDNIPATNEWMPDMAYQLRVRRDDGLLAVMPNYTFSCEGVVKQWIVQWYFRRRLGNCEIVFDFHVLRPTGSCSVTSIGKNRMVVRTGVVTGVVTEDMSVFNISDSERIQVREGDMVGLAVTYNQTYENSYFFGRLTIAKQDDTYSLLTNEVYYVQESFDPDSITEFELECSREHSDDYDEYDSRGNFEGTEFRVYYGTPLINAVVELQPTTPPSTKEPPPTQTNTSTTETPGTSPEIITDPDNQDGEQESKSNMMIPISVVAVTIGGLLIVTTGVITIVCVCYCFRERKKTGDQPDCALSENKAYSLQPSPTYDIKCVNPIYENDDDEYIYMSPEKGIAVDQKKPFSPPQQYSMEHNAAYGTSSLPNTYTTTATAATIVKELSISFRSQKPTASVGKYVGNCFIVEDSVYEVPQ